MFQATRVQAKIFKHFGTDPRCKICKAPLSESPGRLAKLFGKDRSEWNPYFCDACEVWTREHPGGAEVPMSVLFADVRGSTGMAEKREPKEFASIMERFYDVGTKVLNSSDAMVDKPAGDEVRAFYPPVMSRQHARQAILAGIELLTATGHGNPEGPWMPIGVGVHTGTVYAGSVGGEGGKAIDITFVGDMVNVTARLSSLASAGELLVTDAAYDASNLDLDIATSKTISVRGREAPIPVLSFRAKVG